MTGGRLTRSTNDYTIAYARARRDLGCRYTIGFYDRHPELDKKHVVRVESRRPGVHLIYAARYTFQSKEERRQLAIEAAYLVPAQFEGGGLRAHVFPQEPRDAKRWNAILAVEFPVDLGGAAVPSKREFGVVLRRGPDVEHAFSRAITLDGAAADGNASPRVTFVEPVVLRPGTYALTAVLVDPGGERPFGRAVDLTVPPIPKREAILAGPTLGRRRGNDVVVYGDGGEKGPEGDRVGGRDSFRPLFIDEVDRGEPLTALTSVCVLDPRKKDGPWSLARRLETADGAPAGALADLAIAPSPNAPVQCERSLDEIPVPRLKPGRYTFRAVVTRVGENLKRVEAAVPFVVEASESPAK